MKEADVIKLGDSEHIIVTTLKNNGILHRFNNPAGVPYSAIYQYGEEIWSSERKYEAQMIKDWNRSTF